MTTPPWSRRRTAETTQLRRTFRVRQNIQLDDIQTLLCNSIGSTDLQVMPNFGYPVQIWGSTIGDTRV